MDPIDIVFSLFFIGALVWYFVPAKKEKKVSVLYGYPAGRTTWLTIYHRRSTDEWIFEWDDLFDDGRCYKPVNGTQYIKVNDTLKTKKELQNG